VSRQYILAGIAVVIAAPILVASLGTSAPAGIIIGVVLALGGGLWWILEARGPEDDA
jgi:hypothetical protein